MPRHHAPLLTSIWDDEDFCALPADAQRMYMQLLSQKRLSMVGIVPHNPRNWARGCADLTADDIEASLGVLAERNYIVVDHETGELLVRTILKHDPPRGPKSLRGMWNAWREVDSKPLRRAILDHVTDEMWTSESVEPPPEASDLRNTPYVAPSDGACNGASHEEFRPASSTIHLPPTSGHLPSSGTAPSESKALDDELTTKKRNAIDAVVDIRAGDQTKSAAWRTTVRLDVERKHGAKLDDWLQRFPEAPVDVIAHSLESGESRSLAMYKPTSLPPEPERITREQRDAIVRQAKESK